MQDELFESLPYITVLEEEPHSPHVDLRVHLVLLGPAGHASWTVEATDGVSGDMLWREEAHSMTLTQVANLLPSATSKAIGRALRQLDPF